MTWVGDGEICRFSEVTIEKGDNCLYDGESFLSSSGGKFRARRVGKLQYVFNTVCNVAMVGQLSHEHVQDA